MPEIPIIIDAGPVVAFLNQADFHHGWAVEQFKLLPAPLLSCEPVLTEAFHLLRRVPDGPQRLLRLVTRGLFRIDFRIITEAEALERLVRKYHDLPMSLADACLVRMSELQPTALIFTLDQHFKIYRKHGRQVIPSIMPQG